MAIDSNEQMRKRSGEVESSNRLVSFLYILLRDHLPPGTVEEIVSKHVLGWDRKVHFTNGWLARYSHDIARRLLQRPHSGPFVIDLLTQSVLDEHPMCSDECDNSGVASKHDSQCPKLWFLEGERLERERWETWAKMAEEHFGHSLDLPEGQG